MNGLTLLTNLSLTQRSSTPIYTWNNKNYMYGTYSMRLVVPSYTGAVVKLRRSSDNSTSDFYTDANQTYLTTGANNTGTSYSTWIGVNTAYVYTWYDQSGNNNHASNTNNNTTQPNISLQDSKYVVQFQNGNSTVLNISNTQPYSLICQFYNTNSTYGTIITTAYDYQQRFGGAGGGSGTNVNGDSNAGDWYYSGTGTKYSYNNGSSSTTVALNSWNRLSLSIQTPTWVTTSTSGNTSYFNRIGTDGYQNTRAINGYMVEMLLYNIAISTSDMVVYYNNRLF